MATTPHSTKLSGSTRRPAWLLAAQQILQLPLVRRALLAAGLTWGLYLLAANLFLLPQIGPRLLSSRPEKAIYSWQWAFSPFPGLLTVRGLSISGENRENQWYVGLDRGRGRIALMPLMARRFSASFVTASGVDFRLRRKDRFADLAESGTGVRSLFTAIPQRVLPSPYTEAELEPRSRRRPWRLSFGVRALRDVRHLAFDERLLTGDLRIAGRCRAVLRQRSFALPRFDIALQGGKLRTAGKPTATKLDLRASGAVRPFSPRHTKGRAIFSQLDLEASLQATIQSFGVLAELTQSLNGVQLDGAGVLDLELLVRGGAPAPGSQLRLTQAEVELEALGHQLSGSGGLLGTVHETAQGVITTTLNAELAAPRLQGPTPALQLVASQPQPARAQLVIEDWNLTQTQPDAEVTIEVPPLRLASLGALSWYLPHLPALHFTSGSGTVSGSGRFSADPDRSEATLDLEGSEVHLSWEGLALRGNFSAQLVATGLDLEQGTARLDGSQIEVIVDLDEEKGPERWRGWVSSRTGCLDLTKGQARLDTKLSARLDDGRPLLALIAQRRWFLDWFDQLLDLEGLEASGRLIADPRGVVLENLGVQGDAIEIRALLDLRPSPHEGVAFLRYGNLSAAVELESGERDWKLLDSRDWYQERAQRPGIDPAWCL